ncbi:unnamed protein product, partial [Polarella glacialis]
MAAKVQPSSKASCPPQAEWATQYVVSALGIDPNKERPLYAALQGVLLKGFPDGWSMQVDDKNRLFFWNTTSGESLWVHPDHETFKAVVELQRLSHQQPSACFFLRQ